MQNLNIKLSEEERGPSRNVGLSIRNMLQMRITFPRSFLSLPQRSALEGKTLSALLLQLIKARSRHSTHPLKNDISLNWVNLPVPSENSKIKGGSSEGEGKGEKNTAMSSWPRYCYHQDSLGAPFPL